MSEKKELLGQCLSLSLHSRVAILSQDSLFIDTQSDNFLSFIYPIFPDSDLTQVQLAVSSMIRRDMKSSRVRRSENFLTTHSVLSAA
jgi:hypothetical protein